METNALGPHGLALLAYFEGQAPAQLIVRRDDGLEVPVPVSYFFRPPAEFSAIEAAALERCWGHVLDVGAGSGLHSLYLQSKGMEVTAIDVSPEAVETMVRQGVREVLVADVFQFAGGPFDTILMLGHGIGMVGDLPGLDRFLAHARTIATEPGQVLVHSVDVLRTDDPTHLAYHEANRQAGRYVGEIRVQFEYDGRRGPYCGWLHVDQETLARSAAAAGWDCELVVELKDGDYLARLTLALGSNTA